MEIQKGEIILYQREDGSAQLNVRGYSMAHATADGRAF